MRSLLSQPRSLWILFSTEMWERFAYFGTQSILTLYLTSQLNMSDAQAFLLFAAINALIYITPVLGGYIADRMIGYRSAVSLGLVFLMSGYILMSLQQILLFEVGISLVILGNGFLKPNISALLGFCFQTHDTRRDSGFTLFYIGINIGATIGVILCGILVKLIGWSIVFILSGSLLLTGILVFWLGKNIIQQDLILANNQVNNQLHIKKLLLVIIFSLASIWLLVGLLQHPKIVTEMLSIFMLTLIGYMAWIAKNLMSVERKKLMACLILILFSVIFWMIYQQAPMSLMLFIQRCVNLQWFGITIPTSSVWAISGIALLALSPIVMHIWQKLAERKKDFSYPTKFGLGIILMGIGYLLIGIMISLTAMNHSLSLTWIILSFTLQSLGELCLSPIGLAMISVLAPKQMRGLLVGIWFLALALGSDLAGWLAKWAVIPAHTSHSIMLGIYQHAFENYGLIGIAGGLILCLLNPLLKKWINPAQDVSFSKEKESVKVLEY